MQSAFAMGLLVVSAVASPGVQMSRCSDDQARDRCGRDVQKEQQDKYGVSSIEELAAKGSQVVRVFFVDGDGHDAGLVTFVQGPASEPTVEWRGHQRGNGTAPRIPLSAIVPLATWETLQADAHAFDRPLTPEAKEEALSICLHSWVVRIEIVDALGTIHRATQSACNPGLAVRYGFNVAKAAVSVLPACALLDSEKTRNDVTRLAECSNLAGDRAAAAQAFNAYHTTWFANPRGPDFARPLQYMFYERAELSWPGQPAVVGSEDAARVWTTHAGSNPFSVTRIYGETADRVRIDGAILMGARQPDAPRTRVPATMIWTRENGFGFRLRSLLSASSPK